MVNRSTCQPLKVFIVLGLGYGDEGKGLVTDYLCERNENPLVIRFNGGQQAGHTVTLASGKQHVFSNFGSGSLRGIPTYWSAFCNFSPVHFLAELEQLANEPHIFIDTGCTVTTHYDILFGQAVETSRGENRHGSCGTGFGATIDRSKVKNLKLTTADLRHEGYCKEKLKHIRNYYRQKFDEETIFDFEQFAHDEQDELFLDDIRTLKKLLSRNRIQITNATAVLRKGKWQSLIFEGAQGILLDKDLGDKPYITKSSTTSRNALTLLKRHFHRDDLLTEIYYVTRGYATRHGAGPFDDMLGNPNLINNEDETNTENIFQGKFRTSFLDLVKVRYALDQDDVFSKGLTKNLVITCLDQFTGQSLPVKSGKLLYQFSYTKFMKELNFQFNHVLGSFGPTSANVESIL
jgi:adenylosuccinate synthase